MGGGGVDLEKGSMNPLTNYESSCSNLIFYQLQNVTNFLFICEFQITDSLVIADELVVEGNKELKKCLLQKTSTRTELQRAQSKIESGMKRRQELQEEKLILEKRRKELE